VPELLAILALLIWSSLAVSAVALTGVPALFSTGIALAIGGACGLPWIRWRELSLSALLVGAGAMFGYHALYFLSLKLAEPVVANLLHYLWPLLIILLTPALLPNHRLSRTHVIAGLLGFVGIVACVGDAPLGNWNAWWGYVLALVSALIWAAYSVWAKRSAAVPTSTVALYCLLAGITAIATNFFVQESFSVSRWQWIVLIYMGIGPLGGAFYLWDIAMKRGHPQRIALYGYAVPIASTAFVSIYVGKGLTAGTMLGALFVTISVMVGRRAENASTAQDWDSSVSESRPLDARPDLTEP
jgi:drug/metabolite transporter (DMT)-like permease